MSVAIERPMCRNLHPALACTALAALAVAIPASAGEPCACPADLDLDGLVGPSDRATLLGAWERSGAADLEGNGVSWSTLGNGVPSSVQLLQEIDSRRMERSARFSPCGASATDPGAVGWTGSTTALAA